MRARTVACCLVLLSAAGGCGVPPELRGADSPPRPSASAVPSAGPSAPAFFPDPALPPPGFTQFPVPPPVVPTRLGTRPASPSPSATRCTGGPTATQVLEVVRTAPGVPSNPGLRVTSGPYCTDGWQYARIGYAATPAPEPLLVVTRGRPSELRLIEIGTDVCSPVVEANAPAAIRALACD
ncbi:hypothetical protein [Spirilliplanes yamanashiensis]|uniref:hypothetical protein n=1 Tax=Spirilliplanes yamanashiensis TaxID=42233 RepID=UPI00194E163B|nr:hypothetical protein [Spirilliplanes yamanashiensis]MDP9814866.1 hypothetical protein [Spirilliplanes yamanashiensis]